MKVIAERKVIINLPHSTAVRCMVVSAMTKLARKSKHLFNENVEIWQFRGLKSFCTTKMYGLSTSPSETLTASTWTEGIGEEEEQFIPVEVHVDDVIRVAVPPKADAPPVDKLNKAVVGPEIYRAFSLDFKFEFPDSTSVGEMVGKANDLTMKEMAAILGIKDQSRNKYSYWILDVTQEMLVAAQRRGMSKTNQVRSLNWFLFILKQMQFTTLSRRDFFAKLEEMLLIAERAMAAMGSEDIPNPSTILQTQGAQAHFVFYPPLKEEKKEDKLAAVPSASRAKPRQSKVGGSSKGSKESKKPPVKEEADTEEYEDDEEEGELYDPGIPPITEKDLMTMADLLYDIYADRLAYEIIRDVFWEEPLVEVVRISERILAPKMILPEEPNVLKSLEGSIYTSEAPITLAELLAPGEKPDDLTDEQKTQRVQEAEIQRAKDRFIQPLADAIDSAYYRKIFPDFKGISKFVFVKKKNMDAYRQAHMGKGPHSPEKAKKDSKRKSTSGKRQSTSKRKSTSKRQSTARKSVAKRQSMKRKSKTPK